MHPTFTPVFVPQKFSDRPALHGDLQRHHLQLYRQRLDEPQALVRELAQREGGRVSGANFGPLDAHALTLACWGGLVGIDPAERPALWRHIEKVAAHPPVAGVLEREPVPPDPYKPA